MKLTKYDHACLTLEKNDRLIVIDPGTFTRDFTVPNDVSAIVVTHQHADHFDPDLIAAIYATSPRALLLADRSIIDLVPDSRGHAVTAGDKVDVDGFDLEFFGGTHANIHASLPTIANIGVLVDDTLYYPGDSLTLPGKPVDILALPAAAPWLKISEAIDFMTAVRPRFAFPTHDAVLSDLGKRVHDTMLEQAAKSAGITYQRLQSPIEI